MEMKARRKKKVEVPSIRITRQEAERAYTALCDVAGLMQVLWREHGVLLSEYLEFEVGELYIIAGLFCDLVGQFRSCKKHKVEYRAKIMGELGFPAPTGSA